MQSVPLGQATGGVPTGPATEVTVWETPYKGDAAGCCGMVKILPLTVASALSETSIEIGAAGLPLLAEVTRPVRLAKEFAAARVGALTLIAPVVSPTSTPVMMVGA